MCDGAVVIHIDMDRAGRRVVVAVGDRKSEGEVQVVFVRSLRTIVESVGVVRRMSERRDKRKRVVAGIVDDHRKDSRQIARKALQRSAAGRIGRPRILDGFRVSDAVGVNEDRLRAADAVYNDRFEAVGAGVEQNLAGRDDTMAVITGAALHLDGGVQNSYLRHRES